MITRNRAWLIFEFSLLCVVLPTVIIVFRLAPFMFVFLWVVSLYCFLTLRLQHPDFAKDMWKWREIKWKHFKTILPRWVFACVAMVVFLYFYEAERLFALVLERPQLVVSLFILYPLLSALPQEFIFCSFFFERYKTLFTTERARIIASAIVFAYAHVLYINWVAPLFSLIGGLIFALTYSKTRSLALVTIEHALYGNALFLIGLGWYFYGGAVVQ